MSDQVTLAETLLALARADIARLEARQEALETVVNAAVEWRMNADRGTADELLLAVMGAVDDYFRAYRSAVDASRPVEP